MRNTRTRGLIAAVAAMAALGGSPVAAQADPKLDPDRMTLGGIRTPKGAGYVGPRRGKATPSKRRRMNPKHAARRARHARKAGNR